MSESDFTHLAITCPHCGQGNKLSAANLPEDSQIHCSHCCAELGAVAVLQKRVAPDQAEPEHDAVAQ
jgi:hypothetical protein